MTTFRLLRRATVLASFLFASSATAESLTVVSWGGSYEQASRKAILEPFSKKTGIDIRVDIYNGGLAQVRAQVETGKVYWDVIDLEMADAARGCDEGLLEFVDIGDPRARSRRHAGSGGLLRRDRDRLRRRAAVLLHDLRLQRR